MGSDLDLVAVVTDSPLPFIVRPVDWDLTGSLVPTEILVYTAREWEVVLARRDRFAGVMATEVRWLIE